MWLLLKLDVSRGNQGLALARVMDLQLIKIGFGNIVSAKQVVAIVSPDSAPIKRIITSAREGNRLIDDTTVVGHGL